MNQILPAIFNMVINLAMLLLFIRFFLQFADIRRFDPAATPAYKATKIVDTFSSIFPDQAKGRFCTAAVVLLFLVELVYISGNAYFYGTSFSRLEIITVSLFSLLSTFLSAFFYIIIAMVIFSWIIMLTQNMNPLFEIVMRIAEPIIAPFRRISPDLGMIDISPIFAFFSILIVEMLISGVAQRLVHSCYHWLNFCQPIG